MMNQDISLTTTQIVPTLEKVEQELTVLNLNTILSNACKSEKARTAFENSKDYFNAFKENPRLADLAVAYTISLCAEPEKHIQAQELLANLQNKLKDLLSPEVKRAAETILKRPETQKTSTGLTKLAKKTFSSIKLRDLTLDAAESSQILAQRNFENKHRKLTEITDSLQKREKANSTIQKILSIKVKKDELINKIKILPTFVFSGNKMGINKERENVKSQLQLLSREEEDLSSALKSEGFEVPGTENELLQTIKSEQEKVQPLIHRCSAEIEVAKSKLEIAKDITAVMRLLNFPPKIEPKKTKIIFDKINEALIVIKKVDPKSDNFKNLCKKLSDTLHEFSKKHPGYRLKEAEKIILDGCKDLSNNLDDTTKEELNKRIKAVKSGGIARAFQKKIVKPIKNASVKFRKIVNKIKAKDQKNHVTRASPSTKKTEKENKPARKTFLAQHRIRRA